MVNDFLAYASTKYASYDPQSSYYQVRDQQLLWNLDIDLEKLVEYDFGNSVEG